MRMSLRRAGPYPFGGTGTQLPLPGDLACPRSSRSMSEHRRKPPQPQGGGRAAARRAAQQPSGRRAAPSRGATSGSPSASYGEERPYGGRAEARRAAQRGGGAGASTKARAPATGAGAAARRGGGGGGQRPGRGRGGRPPQEAVHRLPAPRQVRLAALGAVVEAGHRALPGLRRQPDGAPPASRTRWSSVPDAERRGQGAEQRLLLGRRHADGRHRR